MVQPLTSFLVFDLVFKQLLNYMFKKNGLFPHEYVISAIYVSI